MSFFDTKTSQKKSNRRVLLATIVFFAGFFIFLASLPSLSAELGDDDALIDAKTKELNLQRLAQMQNTANQHTMKLENIISYNSMPQYANGSVASLKVLGQVSKAFVNAPQANSLTQKLAQKKVSKAAQYGNMNFSMNLSSSGARAEMNYGPGFTAAVSYDASSAGPKVELNHPLGTNRSIAIIHDAGPYGRSEDKVGFRWGF